MRVSTSQRVAATLRPSSIERKSRAPTPAAVLSKIGYVAAKESKKEIAASPRPNAIIAIGISESGKIMGSS